MLPLRKNNNFFFQKSLVKARTKHDVYDLLLRILNHCHTDMSHDHVYLLDYLH